MYLEVHEQYGTDSGQKSGKFFFSVACKLSLGSKLHCDVFLQTILVQ